MTDVRNCSRCGAVLPVDHDPAQPCPRCLLRVGMDVSSISSSAQRVPAPSIAELQPHFDKLELLELVGEGGMGAVYKARHKELDRIVAVKVLTVRDEQSATFDERFAREARAMATLTHPHIAAVYDFGKLGGWSFLILEYIEGQNLRQVMRSRVVEPREALRWIAQICEALQYAHEHGVVHRDIKPENILIDGAGNAKVVDFGLAKLLVKKPGEATLTGPQQSMGTWHYMAPEQYERPATVDHRADIFSLGVVFYELLTGKLPVGAFAPASQKLQIDVRVDEVVLKALAREPEQRYQHASEVKTDVDNLSSAPSVAAARKQPWSAGKWVAVILAVLLVPAMFGCLSVLLFWGVRATSADNVPMAIASDGSAAPSAYAADADPSPGWLRFAFPLVFGVILVSSVLLAVWLVWAYRHRSRARAGTPANAGEQRHVWGAGKWVAVTVALLVVPAVLGVSSVFFVVWREARTDDSVPAPPATVQSESGGPPVTVVPTAPHAGGFSALESLLILGVIGVLASIVAVLVVFAYKRHAADRARNRAVAVASGGHAGHARAWSSGKWVAVIAAVVITAVLILVGVSSVFWLFAGRARASADYGPPTLLENR
jgi:tRNA A-37 threonylcarbamoyl transferase component Bud32